MNLLGLPHLLRVWTAL